VIRLADDVATVSKELRDRLLVLRPLAMTADQSHRFALTFQDTGSDSGGCQ
jgi:hypothetical protein